MNYKKCWLCNEWTRTDFLRQVMFEQQEESVCLKCKNKLDERNQSFETEILREEAIKDAKGHPFGKHDRLPRTRGDIEEERDDSELGDQKDDKGLPPEV